MVNQSQFHIKYPNAILSILFKGEVNNRNYLFWFVQVTDTVKYLKVKGNE